MNDKYIGKKYNRWTIVEKCDYKTSGDRVYKCICECGNSKEVKLGNLKNGSSKSCGCLQKERASKSNKTHGMSNTKLFMVWQDMIRRCNNSNHHAYNYYGGKGIVVCDMWLEFSPFYDWALDNGYSNGLSIDRINVNQGYEPNNCRWVTMKVQANNRTSNRSVEFYDKWYTIQELCEKYSISRTTINKFLNNKNYSDTENIIIAFRRKLLECRSKGGAECFTCDELMHIKNYDVKEPKIIYKNKIGRYYKDNGEIIYI